MPQGQAGARTLRLPPFKVQFAAAAAMTLLFILWSREGWGGERATVAFADVASTLVPVGAAWACWRRARMSPPDLRQAWALIGAAALAWGIGQLYWTIFELRTGAPPEVPSPADIGYLALIPLAAVGTTLMVRRTGRGLDPRPMLDGAIVGASFIFIAFALGLEQIVLDSPSPDLALIVNLLYPFGDGLVLGVALLRLSRAPRQARGAVGLLTMGFVMLAVADLWFLVVDAQGLYSTGGILDAFWIMGFQLIGLSAVRPGNLEATVDEPPQTTGLALVPLYPFFLALAVGIYAELRDGEFSDTLFWTALVVIFLMVGRLVVILLDNFALNRRLQEERSMRTLMLNSVTHDLLSPLSAVRIQMKLLKDDRLGPRTPKQANALAIVDRNVERVQRLGGDLKDLVNIEGSGGLVVVPQPFDLAAEVQRCAAAFQAEAAERGVELTVQSPATAAAFGDPGRIGQVLDNLVSNALKFTPRGGRVLMALRMEGACEVKVTDSGRGMEPHEAARLFRPFSQVHQPGEVKEAGTGLGLFISRGIAGRHGGELTASSPGRGQGTTFTLRLPLPPPTSPPAAASLPADKPADDAAKA